MDDPINNIQDTKDIFRRCGACSNTFAHILNREFGQTMELEELASNPLVGGMLNQGHQCGMLWGAALALGAESFRRQKDLEKATAVAVTATHHIVDSFRARATTVNCREIIGIDLRTVFGLVKFMLKTMARGVNNSQCFNLAEAWAPEAIESGKEGLSQELLDLQHRPTSCASEVVKKMGGNEEEQAMVSGFAGGLGLSGNACGALAAAIWMQTLKWCQENPGKNPPMFNNPRAKELLKVFQQVTNGEMQCSRICGQRFESIDDHSQFIINGGCSKIIQMLSEN